ncbi:MAG: transcriptional regulator TetR family [Eubacterium sp.]|jgi:hypothetical protein|nr:transcriptional regulator TetR family [Eubacterium sp.]
MLTLKGGFTIVNLTIIILHPFFLSLVLLFLLPVTPPLLLSYYNPKVAEILEAQRRKTLQTTIGYFIQFKNSFNSEDIKATAIVIFDLISTTVDRIVFGKNEIDRERSL